MAYPLIMHRFRVLRAVRRTSASRLAMVNPMVTLPGKKCRVLHTQYIHANGCLVLQHAWIRPISPLTPALTLSCSQP
uniref:Uncharacterized protein n=1 Tax=Coccidioides posadasii RMSCC 3488 TaxID=454284 RepID=A0A0J6FAJ5_COCPO|nr:hypothetical protein CPAG_02600 [Coccidioides posadasii RMSCC 3488]